MICVCLQEDKWSNVEFLHKIEGGIRRPDFTSGFAEEPHLVLVDEHNDLDRLETAT